MQSCIKNEDFSWIQTNAFPHFDRSNDRRRLGLEDIKISRDISVCICMYIAIMVIYWHVFYLSPRYFLILRVAKAYVSKEWEQSDTFRWKLGLKREKKGKKKTGYTVVFFRKPLKNYSKRKILYYANIFTNTYGVSLTK